MSFLANINLSKKLQANGLPYLSVFDIESRNWKDFVIGGLYNGKDYKEFYNIKDFIKLAFLPDYYTPIMYAHFGGIFDFLFVIDFLFTENSENLRIDGLILQGRKILKFEIIHGSKSITFIDSSGLFPFSLKTLTHSFDVEHKKLDDDVSKITKITKKLRKYLEHDCKGLYESLEKFAETDYIKDVGLKLTRSGTSFAVYKKFLKDKGQLLPKIPKNVRDFARKSYFGGRTEIFKPLYKGYKKPLKVYDINSLYPSVMHDFEYPSNFQNWSLDYQPDALSIYHVIITCPHDLKIPLLPIKSDGKLIFPTGTFEGYYTNIEINKALTLGYKIDKVIKGAIFSNGGYMFKDFVNHFYTLRKETDDPVKKIIYKDILNHLYGRLAINEHTESITFEKPEGEYKIHSKLDFDDYEIRTYAQDKIMLTYSNPALSTFVTSYARIRLYEYMESVGLDNVYYCDTDSIFIPIKLKESNELGKMKLEYELKEACFLLPKTYSGIKLDGDLITKMKGFPQKNIGHIEFNDFVESLSGEIRLGKVKTNGGLAGLKTALKKGEILHVLPESTKQLRSRYDKRIITFKNKKYDTIPHHIEHQTELF